MQPGAQLGNCTIYTENVEEFFFPLSTDCSTLLTGDKVRSRKFLSSERSIDV